jgi:hypothetical protein
MQFMKINSGPVTVNPLFSGELVISGQINQELISEFGLILSGTAA